MTPSPLSQPRIWFASAVLAISLPVLAQGAAPDKASIEASYQRDRAACQSIGVPQDRSNCLRDAGAARAQALRTGRRTPSSEELTRNAVQRCQRHPPEERVICERMARGEGTVSGSVQGGGTIRELVTQEPLPPPPPVSPPPMQSVPMPSPMSPPPMTSPPPMSPPPVMPAPTAPPPLTTPSAPTLPR